MKRLVLIIAVITCCMGTSAQTLSKLLSSDNQSLVIDAVRGAFCLVEQSFQIQDAKTDERYNLEGQDCFGKAKGLGIMTGNGLFVNAGVSTPWLGNEDLKKYPDFSPVLSNATISHDRARATAAKVVYSKLSDAICSMSIANPETLCLVEGLEIDSCGHARSGWVVWAYERNNELSFQCSRVTIEEGADCIAMPRMANGLIGGAFFIVDDTRVGTIKFLLSGIVTLEGTVAHMNRLSSLMPRKIENAEPHQALTSHTIVEVGLDNSK